MGRAPRSTEYAAGRGFSRLSFIAMGSPCELLIDTDSEPEARRLGGIVAAEAWRIEDKFSRYLPGNIVDRINRGGPVTVDDETANLLDFSAMLHEMSTGRFDITSGALREAWTFDCSDNVPSPATVAKILARVGWSKVTWRRPLLELGDGMQVDFGGVAKEYAVDRAATLASAETEAACLVNFGGDLVATKSPSSGDGWHVGIDALGQVDGRATKRIRLRNGGLATSGDARRFLLKDGIRYGHILDPTTGWPVAGAPRSITVAADTCTQAGMLSTLAMLKGKAAEDFLDQQDVRYWILRQDAVTPSRISSRP
ncbi:MAG: FAD:protein FMN transferase [Gammaproteobacteria bacterium]|nr:FAD:protein FMN transferase [Gammaproteobacteria bacterium]